MLGPLPSLAPLAGLGGIETAPPSLEKEIVGKEADMIRWFYLGWEMAGDMDLEDEDPVGEGEGLGLGLGLGRASAALTPPSSRDSGRPSSLPSCNNHNWKML